MKAAQAKNGHCFHGKYGFLQSENKKYRRQILLYIVHQIFIHTICLAFNIKKLLLLAIFSSTKSFLLSENTLDCFSSCL
ncbi:MAG TPA: hypothetical protein DEP27_07140 [Ruminococcaceae bacterium]|nr:hypothetical protein [Oscillospiraceae bacterium]